jgi:hypothetical protein
MDSTFTKTILRKTAPNTGFASGGVTCKLGALCFYSGSVLVNSFVLRSPPERKAGNRWPYCRFNLKFVLYLKICVNQK